MRNALFIFCIMITCNLFSQDTAITHHPNYLHGLKADTNKIEILFNNHYLYKAKVLNDGEMFAVLQKTEDPKIKQLVHQSLNAGLVKNVGGLAIPLAIVTIGYAEASISKVYNRNGTTDYKKKNLYQSMAMVCFVATLACPTISIIMKRKYKKTTAEAIKLYNEKY